VPFTYAPYDNAPLSWAVDIYPIHVSRCSRCHDAAGPAHDLSTFELWKADRDKHFTPVDPRERLSECKLVKHYDRFTPAPPEAQKEAA